MTIGELRDRVTVQQKSTSADGQGGRSVTTWGTLATVWANVTPVRMAESLQAASIGAHLEYLVTVRYRSDVTPAMRLSWTPYSNSTAKTLEIHGVQALDGMREFLSLACSEVI